MFALDPVAPLTVELVSARGDIPAVTATFNGQPSPLSLRAARRAVHAILRDGLPNAMERAADAFSVELVRHNLLSWEGIGDVDGAAVEPTHDRELRGAEGEVTGVEPGTISAFVAQPRLMEAADREYVVPWSERDAEKNGYAPSPNGTSAGATPVDDTASKPATPAAPADATSARTKSTKPGRTRARRSGN